MNRLLKTLSVVMVLPGVLRAAGTRELSLEEARSLAIANHPRISLEAFKVMAAEQNARSVRAGYYPTLFAQATAVGVADENTRIAAGGLSNPGIFNRNAEGITLTQRITDFGRTENLSASARLHGQAEEAGLRNVQGQVVLLTDTAYFEALRATTVLEVARQTQETRRVLLDQVSALAENHLKSDLDRNFAQVSLDESRLLALQAEADQKNAFSQLSMLTGLKEVSTFQLHDVAAKEEKMLDANSYVQQALTSRPELQQLELEAESARKLARAERAANYPTVSILGAAGVIPLHDSHFENNYAVGGLQLSVPLYAGGLYSAKSKEALLKAEAAAQLLRARQDEVLRDVHVAVLAVNTAAERIQVSQRLAEHADQAFALAQARYGVGGASIVELSQAQLSKTLAAIEAATARYNYQIQIANLKYQTGVPVVTISKGVPGK